VEPGRRNLLGVWAASPQAPAPTHSCCGNSLPSLCMTWPSLCMTGAWCRASGTALHVTLAGNHCILRWASCPCSWRCGVPGSCHACFVATTHEASNTAKHVCNCAAPDNHNKTSSLQRAWKACHKGYRFPLHPQWVIRFNKGCAIHGEFRPLAAASHSGQHRGCPCAPGASRSGQQRHAAAAQQRFHSEVTSHLRARGRGGKGV
jgi:hypothetical protein